MLGEELYEIAAVPQQRVEEAVCVATFDAREELLWTGTDGGSVQAYGCPALSQYAVFSAHAGPVVGLLSAPQGILSASAPALRLHSRGGLPLLTLRDSGGDVQCIEWEWERGGRVLVGHAGASIALLDLATGATVCEVPTGEGVTVLRSNGRVVACGGAGGELSLRDVRSSSSMRAEATLDAHLGAVMALDLKGDLLASCGLSQRLGRVCVDSLVKVFDVRQGARALAHIPFAPRPSMLRFHPKLSSLLLVASAGGAVMTTDVQAGGVAYQTYQLDCQGDALLTCDMAPSGELVAFGDTGGYVHLWGASEDARVALHFPPEGPLAPPPAARPVPIQALKLPLTGEAMCVAGAAAAAAVAPLSAVDPNIVMRVGRAPRVVAPALRQHMQVNDFVGYAQIPHWRRGMPYCDILAATAAIRNARLLVQVPAEPGKKEGERSEAQHLHEQQLSLPLGGGNDMHGGAIAAAAAGWVGGGETAAVRLPRGYRRVEIKAAQKTARFEFEFDFSYYNRTRFAGLENDGAHAFLNALLQVLFLLPPLRARVTRHICEREFCLTCELAFLLHMLHLAQGGHATTCQCVRARHDAASHDRRSFQVDLQYPAGRAAAVAGGVSFCEVLERSLGASEDVRAWCRACHSYQALRQTRVACCPLPPLLLLGCAIRSDSELSYWQQQQQQQTAAAATGAGAGGAWLPAYVAIRGVSAANHAVSVTRLQHPVDDVPADATVYELTAMIAHIYDFADAPEEEEEDEGDQQQLYDGHLVAHIKVPAGDGPAAHSGTLSPRLPHHARHLQHQVAPHRTATHAGSPRSAPPRVLPGMEHLIVEGSTAAEEHPLMRSSSSSSSRSEWLLFNDFCITPTTAHEVVSMYGRRKVPCLLFYTRVLQQQEEEQEEAACASFSSVPLDMFERLMTAQQQQQQRQQDDVCEDEERPLQLRPLQLPSEAPHPGMLLGIDAEFVALSAPQKGLRNDGVEFVRRPARLGLARVSVVRGQGAHAGVCCIDDYIRTVEPVYDYLTRYSGLQHGDLDASNKKCKHNITTLKTAYLKLRYLVDRGCRFVGHGLKKDFRMINIVVPPAQLDIQKETHDSIEDARTLLEMYSYGRQYGWEIVTDAGVSKDADQTRLLSSPLKGATLPAVSAVSAGAS
eukprot:jgi/Mesen1/10212/ME000077S09547